MEVGLDDDLDDDEEPKVENDTDDAEEEEDDETEEDNKRDSSKKSTKNNPHCTINFVKNTPYQFLASDSNTKIWAEGIITDPAPKPPTSRSMNIQAGDYVLVAGSDLTLKKTGRSSVIANFEPNEELILTADWVQFDEDMTGQDLVDLGDVPFLLWWQNIKPPTVRKPIPKKAVTKKKVPAKKKVRR
jgi:hypothetical protein